MFTCGLLVEVLLFLLDVFFSILLKLLLAYIQLVDLLLDQPDTSSYRACISYHPSAFLYLNRLKQAHRLLAVSVIFQFTSKNKRYSIPGDHLQRLGHAFTIGNKTILYVYSTKMKNKRHHKHRQCPLYLGFCKICKCVKPRSNRKATLAEPFLLHL